MEGLRQVTGEGVSPSAPCGRCGATGCPWDRIAGKPMCPDCQETLVLGDGPPLMERPEPNGCAACGRSGTLRYLTFPLHAPAPMELDLCPSHFRALLARRLDRVAFRRLREHFQGVGVALRQVFLLHEAFYDDSGRPLQPVPEE